MDVQDGHSDIVLDASIGYYEGSIGKRSIV